MHEPEATASQSRVAEELLVEALQVLYVTEDLLGVVPGLFEVRSVLARTYETGSERRTVARRAANRAVATGDLVLPANVDEHPREFRSRPADGDGHLGGEVASLRPRIATLRSTETLTVRKVVPSWTNDVPQTVRPIRETSWCQGIRQGIRQGWKLRLAP